MNKITSFFTILVCAITCSACDFFSGGGASITVSLDADSLRKFVNENVSSNPVTKGNYQPDSGVDSLSLKVTLSGDETGVWTSDIPDKPNYTSNVSVKVDGLRVGAKMKVRVDLVQDGEKIIISGGTKNFRVSSGDNNVPIAMGNYSDVIVWNPNADYWRGEIDSGFNFVSPGFSSWVLITFDASNSSLHFLDAIDNYWYNTFWRQYDLTASDSKSTILSSISSPTIVAQNGSLYYCEGGWVLPSTFVDIYCIEQDLPTTSKLAFSLNYITGNFTNSAFMVHTLAFAPNGKKAYLAFAIDLDGANNHVYYLMSFDVSTSGTWTRSSTVKIAQSGDFLGSAINYNHYGSPSDFFKITDIRVQDGYIWILVKDGTTTSTSGLSRGALIRYDMSLGNGKVFGWTGDRQGPKAHFTGNDCYRTPPSKNSTNFFGPIKFVAVRPGELVIADDGGFADPVLDASTFRNITNINRIVIFDIEKEAVSDVHNIDGYAFDGDYPTTPTGSFYPFPD